MKSKVKPPSKNLLSLPVIVIAAVAAAFIASGDGSYRYPCQNPDNFAEPWCNPPICLAAENCTYMVLDLGEYQ